MAGVAPQRAGGSNATTIGMVVSIVVAVILLGVLIFMFTNQEQLRTSARNDRDALARIANLGDRSAAQQQFPDATGAGRTLIGEMLKGIGLLTGRVTGNTTDTPTAAATKLDGVLTEIASAGKVPNPDSVTSAQGAATIIRQLHDWFVAEQQAKTTAQADLAKANADLEAAVAANKAMQDKFASDYASLGQKVADMQKTKSDFETKKNSDLDKLKHDIEAKQDALAQLRKDRFADRQSWATELSSLDKMIEDQKRIIGEVRGPGPEGAQALAVARNPVGCVLRALPGESLVHIGLGRENNVSIGMNFAVYSAGTRVPESGRGKANVEVVSVGHRTSECRVTSPASPDDPILEGDAVGNILLSRNGNRKQKFCIVGRFDLNYDGQPDLRGLDAIRAFIERFGGQVVDKVDATTDFLIVGTLPPDVADMEPAPRTAVTEPEPDEAATETEDEAAATEDDSADTEADADSEDADSEDADEDTGDDSEADDEEDSEADTEEDTGADDEEADTEDTDASEDEDAAADEESDDASDEDSESDADAEEDADEEDASDDDESKDDMTAAADETPDTPEPADKDTSTTEVVAAVPTIARPGMVDPARPARVRRQLTERQLYDEAIRRADALMIPRLTQDHFFNFIGMEAGPDILRQMLD